MLPGLYRCSQHVPRVCNTSFARHGAASVYTHNNCHHIASRSRSADPTQASPPAQYHTLGPAAPRASLPPPAPLPPGSHTTSYSLRPSHKRTVSAGVLSVFATGGGAAAALAAAGSPAAPLAAPQPFDRLSPVGPANGPLGSAQTSGAAAAPSGGGGAAAAAAGLVSGGGAGWGAAAAGGVGAGGGGGGAWASGDAVGAGGWSSSLQSLAQVVKMHHRLEVREGVCDARSFEAWEECCGCGFRCPGTPPAVSDLVLAVYQVGRQSRCRLLQMRVFGVPPGCAPAVLPAVKVHHRLGVRVGKGCSTAVLQVVMVHHRLGVGVW